MAAQPPIHKGREVSPRYLNGSYLVSVKSHAMASSIASQVYLGDGSTQEGSLEIYIPKQTAIDKIGGILCHICNNIFGNKKDYDSHYVQHKMEGSNIIVYTCVVCKKQIPGYPSFRGHCYLNHVVKNKFQCKHCNKSFCKLSILNGHISAVHEYKCSSCDEKFTTKKELLTHKIIHTKKLKNEPPYDCIKCGIVLKTVDVCENHIDDHCEMLYPCPICSEVIPDKIEAIKHLTKHFDENVPPNLTSSMPFISEDSSIDILGGILCCHCDLLFRNRNELDSHFTAEHEDKTIVYTCNICGKQYEKYGMFGSHCYLHFSKDRFQCDQCMKTFPRLSLLVIHTEAFHTGCTTNKPFSCEQCGHRFMTQQRLREHLRIVHEDSCVQTVCLKPGCSAKFEKPRDLIVHLKKHRELENWCRQCGLQFASLASASRHLDVHRRKQYLCPVCDRSYREKYMLVKHVPAHFESVLHVCKVCGRAYSARNRLVQHLKSHSEQRAYPCSHCPKSFVKPHQLQEHLNMHTGRRPYHCTHCPKTFAYYPNWNKHLSRIHGVDKASVRQLKLAQDADNRVEKIAKREAEPPEPAEPAPSEASLDLYAFESEEDDERRDWAPPARRAGAAHLRELHTICDPISGRILSVTDTVNAAIDRIDSMDEDFDLMVGKSGTGEGAGFESNVSLGAVDDASDIKAIVEHIDAMSGEMEAAAGGASVVDGVSGPGASTEMLQFADMLPVDNAVFNTVPEPEQLLPMWQYAASGCEYGPELAAGVLNLDDHMLPHIDPLLTIKAQENAKMYVQNLNNFNFDRTAPVDYDRAGWEPPIITKIYSYEETNDANSVYIC